MTVAVRIPPQLRDLTGGRSSIDVDALTVTDALAVVCDRCPGIHPRLFDDAGQLRRYVNVFVGEEDVRFLRGLATELTPGDTLSILPAIAGG